MVQNVILVICQIHIGKDVGDVGEFGNAEEGAGVGGGGGGMEIVIIGVIHVAAMLIIITIVVEIINQCCLSI